MRPNTLLRLFVSSMSADFSVGCLLSAYCHCWHATISTWSLCMGFVCAVRVCEFAKNEIEWVKRATSSDQSIQFLVWMLMMMTAIVINWPCVQCSWCSLRTKTHHTHRHTDRDTCSTCKRAHRTVVGSQSNEKRSNNSKSRKKSREGSSETTASHLLNVLFNCLFLQSTECDEQREREKGTIDFLLETLKLHKVYCCFDQFLFLFAVDCRIWHVSDWATRKRQSKANWSVYDVTFVPYARVHLNVRLYRLFVRLTSGLIGRFVAVFSPFNWSIVTPINNSATAPNQCERQRRDIDRSPEHLERNVIVIIKIDDFNISRRIIFINSHYFRWTKKRETETERL